MRPSPPFVLLVLAAAAAVSTASAQTEFSPSVSGETVYSDNIFYEDSATAASDTAFAVGLDLPWSKRWRTGDLVFRYNPRLLRYNDFDELDRTDHFLDFSVRRDLSRKANLTFAARASKTQAQAVTPDDPFALTERVDRDRYDLDLNYDRQVGQRWRWRTRAGVASQSNELVAGAGTGTTVEDRDQTRLSTGFVRRISPKTGVGFDLQFQRNSLDDTGDEDVRTAAFTVTREISQRSSMDFAVGAFSTDNEDQGLSDRSGAYARLQYNRDYRRLVARLFVEHAPTSGGNLPGTATNTTAGVALTSVGTRSVFWNVAAVVARRDPADSALPEVDTDALQGQVTWLFHPKLGLRLTASSVSQTEDTPMGAEIDVLSALAGLVWYPKGHRGRLPG